MTHSPDEKSRAWVSGASQSGGRNEDIAKYLDIDLNTLKKHYKDELEKGRAVANINLGKQAYQMAMNGNVAMLIFLLKVRLGLSERVTVRHENVPTSTATDDDLWAIATRGSGLVIEAEGDASEPVGLVN